MVKNQSHTLLYSLIGLQEMNLAYNYPSIYWNTANLIVDSGGSVDIEGKSTNYNKIAIAINKMKTSGINISLININKSDFDFTPDEEENQILYGLSALNKVGKEIAQKIIENRPYTSLADFQKKVKANKTVMISLIKSGAFDQFGPREEIMREYIWTQCEPKKRLTMQNFNGLMVKGLLPEELKFQERLFVFNKALKANCALDGMYVLKADNYYNFYEEFFDIDLLEPYGEKLAINQKTWKKLYDGQMVKAKNYIKANHDVLLEKFNNTLFQEMWDRYAEGSLSKWEMDSLGMYYHKHELAHINGTMYDIVSYNSLPEEPIVDYKFKRGNIEIPIFKLVRIAGTVIAKDDIRSSISILTADSGVVTVKMTRDYFARYNKQISEPQPDGTKKVMEKSWFGRGNLVIVQGYRRGDLFMMKRYKKSPWHQLYKIDRVNNDGTGTIESRNWRYGEEPENE